MASSPIGSKNNVKIFVLYLMENINYPLDFVTINDIVMQTDYVMYLDFAESFNEMLDGGLIEELKNYNGTNEYVVTEKGRCVARELKSDIITSILDKSLACALRYIDFNRRGIEASCSIEPREDGRYTLTCVLEEHRVEIFRVMMVADNMKKQGGFIPGIRPGKPTSEYLNNVLNRIVFIGVIGLIIVSVLPFFFNGIFGASVSFGGTSLIIIVSVILETVKQIESQMLVRNYKGFLND